MSDRTEEDEEDLPPVSSEESKASETRYEKKTWTGSMNVTAVRLTVQTVGHLEKQGSGVRGTTCFLFLCF